MDDMDRLQDAMADESTRLQIERARREILERTAVAPAHRECHECGEPIPKARLAARPLAVLCVDCQQDSEAGRS